MADNAEGGDAPAQEVTFKVKSSNDKIHTITIPESATVSELKTRLAGDDYEGVAPERQRLIYSGRVMKNDDALSVYKIKPNNTVHMVKSAASNPAPQAGASAAAGAGAAAGGAASAASQIPTNMAAGTANNPLAGLTGARYAGHVPLPSRSLFGADGGMGAPPDSEEMARLMSDPTVQQSLNAALDNPDFINMLIESNPTLRNVPGAREMLQSPLVRQMMTNPDMIRMMSQMQGPGGAMGGAAAFPAPGATDTTPDGAPATNAGAGAGAGAGTAGAGAGAGAGGAQNPFSPFMFMPFPGAGAAPGSNAQGGAAGDQPAGAGQPPANPFLAFLNPNLAAPGGAGGGAAGGAPGAGGLPQPDFQRALQALMGGGAGGAGGLFGAPEPPAPVDNRPPEERYADQLRQLNDMGFYDFDRNVAALRRSGGSVQGAIEHLLG